MALASGDGEDSSRINKQRARDSGVGGRQGVNVGGEPIGEKLGNDITGSYRFRGFGVGLRDNEQIGGGNRGSRLDDFEVFELHDREWG